tara:strand:- start:1990 stop:2460 length:471 start_codon:yes stop_codon:yes gene_type:complete
MDIYTISFLISTLWIGPFWYAMLVHPNKTETKELMSKSLFFMGPIIIWFLLMLLNPQGLTVFFNMGSHPEGFIIGISDSLATKIGVTATWAHMVAGDILATRWVWADGIKRSMNLSFLRLSIFFCVILMPVGLLLHLILRKRLAKHNEFLCKNYKL